MTNRERELFVEYRKAHPWATADFAKAVAQALAFAEDPMYIIRTVEELWQCLNTSRGPESCWLWKKGLNARGYAYIKIDGKAYPLQRAISILFDGPIPDGIEIDHVCRVKRCGNPTHLQRVTHKQNALNTPKAQQEYCKRGHLLAGDNLMWDGHGCRYCRTCHNQSDRDRRRK